ncbi:MAG: ATP-binding cassette domain-containing protein [Opitutales bacterium]|nr:ATP-binding cassette domain-containing protein [Opitutales bacterium]
MLSCKNLTVRVSGEQEPILSNATLSFKPRAMNAVIGPSGCGKTTLLKAMMRLIDREGESYFCNEEILSSESLVGKVGYAPQFTCAHPKLTVFEAVESALKIGERDASKIGARAEQILKIIGLDAHANKQIESLSGGQLRRMGLGLELAANPPAMFCDEVTSGLDPLSENTILDMLKNFCQEGGKTIICIIHNLAKLDYFDLVTVVYEGRVVFQGSPKELNSHFEIDSPLNLYDALNARGVEYWLKKRPPLADYCAGIDAKSLPKPKPRPGALSQIATLLARRYKLFFRDSGYLLLTMAITFGFPIVVVIFAFGGLPQIRGLALERSLGGVEELRETLRFSIEAAQTSTLVTGLILFQVVLLTLMGSNNSAREIAGERNLFEKERLLGLRPWAYAASKVVFTSSIALFQGIWMCWFVKFVCDFPGDFFVQAAVLSGVCVSMTLVCLAFSALFSSPDKANIVSIYLVGFQLPLSGIVLALPECLKWVCRPLINSYWGWAGFMTSMKDTRLYDAFVHTSASYEWIASPGIAVFALALQGIIGIAFALKGCYQKKWN